MFLRSQFQPLKTEDRTMIQQEHPASPAPRSVPPHRYQVYRQARNGVHHSHGESIDSPEGAVTHFLHATPVFEGGGLHLWDHREQRAVASADWQVETTRMGFPVRLRANVFHDISLAALAEQIAEREKLEQTITNHIRLTA
jgi:hypothetical protein